MILHQAESLQWEQDVLLAGRAAAVPIKFFILSEKKNYILSQILPEDYSLQLPFEKVPHGSLKLFPCPEPGCLHNDDTGMARVWVDADAGFCSRGRMIFCSAWQKGKHSASSNIKKNIKLGKLCCQTALGTQLLLLCKYSWRKEPRNTDKMEQALEPEDVLSCCLVLKHNHSSRHTGTELGRVLAAKLPVSAWTN